MHFSFPLILALTSLVSAQSCAVVSSHNVTKGQTLTSIGSTYGVNFAQLLAANPDITDADLIEVGQIIGIPGPTCVPGSATAKCPGVSTYIVESGDTLLDIADDNDLSLAQILAANPSITNPDLIQIGQVVALPSVDCVPASKTRQVSARNSPLPPSTCLTSGPATYTVVGFDGFYAIAVQKLGVTYQALLDANPQVTNANVIEVGQVLKVPLCSTVTSTNSTSVTNITCVPSAVATYIVQSGDTLYKIAEANNATLTAIKAVNSQIVNFDSIEVGEIVNLPSCSPFEEEVVEATTFTCAVTGNATYTIVAGDSLSAIAARIPITLASLEAANSQIEDFDFILVNQTINIPLCPDCIATNATVSTHTIVSGDSLSAIAGNFSVSLDGLLAQNPAITNPDLIYPGQNISIPICGVSPTAAVTCSTASNGTYVVKSGDTFSAIALSFGITVDSLTSANSQVVNIDAIEVGQVLNVPVCGTPPSSSAAASIATATNGSVKPSATVIVNACPTSKGYSKKKGEKKFEGNYGGKYVARSFEA